MTCISPTCKGVTCSCRSDENYLIIDCVSCRVRRRVSSAIQIVSDIIFYDIPLCCEFKIGCSRPCTACYFLVTFIPTAKGVSCPFGIIQGVCLVVGNRYGSVRNRSTVGIECNCVGVSLPICLIASVANATFLNGYGHGKTVKTCSCPTDEGIACLGGVNESKAVILDSVFYGIVGCYFTLVEVVLNGVLFFTPYGIEFHLKSAADLVIVSFKFPFNKTITASAGCLDTTKISRRIISKFYGFGNTCSCGCKRGDVRCSRCTQKNNTVIVFLLRSAQICCAGEVTAAHTICELNRYTCRENFLNTFFKGCIINFFNTRQNSYTLFAIRKSSDILIDFHSFIVFACIEQLIRFVIANEGDNQSK